MNRTDRLAGAVIVILHMVGMIGILSPWKDFFVPLTPANLIISLVALIWVLKPLRVNQSVALLAIFAIGFGAEWLGVHTGLLFGDYQYGSTLGLKWDEIPLLIGVNWILVTGAAYGVMQKFASQSSIRIIGAVLLMVSLDYFIEPVAMALDFWSWDGNTVPLKNYMGWAGVSLMVVFIYDYYFKQMSFRNTPLVLYFSMLGFFIIIKSSL
jgi:putative membrane protein